jgi:ABC-type glycerol-3-phosphate transport system permease component
MATQDVIKKSVPPASGSDQLRSLLFGNRAKKGLVSQGLTYVALLFLAALFLLPFYWMLNTALKPLNEVFAVPPIWFPTDPQWSNFIQALTQRVGSAEMGETEGTIPVSRYFFNTALITINGVIATVFSSSLVAYAFARLQFPGRDKLFLLVLATMMIPFAVVMVPQFIIWRNLNWLDTFLPLMVPHWFGSAWNIFLLRQFFRTIPLEYDEAALIDGASRWQIYWYIIMPLSVPALAAVAVFAFVFYWNDFLGPLIILSTPQNFTLTMFLYNFSVSFWQVTPWNLYMAAALVIIAPCLILFFATQKVFLRGISVAEIKR